MASKKTVDKLELSADDICKILEVSARTGVTTLTAFGLSVSFQGSTASKKDQEPTPESYEHESISRETLEEEQKLLEQAKIDDMMITDPVAYEESLMRGDLVDEETQPE
jgi:hypothetical protein